MVITRTLPFAMTHTGIPMLVEMPAPVMTRILWDAAMTSATS
jgi:hypothetical protein